MNENRGTNLFEAMVDRQAEAAWCLLVLTFLLGAALFVAFGAYDVEAIGDAAAGSAEASHEGYGPYVWDHGEPFAYLAARAAGIAAAEPTGASLWHYEEPYAYLAARAVGIAAAEPVAGGFLPLARGPAFEPCC